MKVLGAVRLSRLTDESTSPARQRERIEWWAQGHDGTVVAITEDMDTSGAVDPFKRESLGKWLSDTPPEPWDVLVAWKLDRISRSSMDTETLLRWCLDRGKRIVCVDDGIDTDTQMGQLWVKLASIFAEVERNAIKERITQGRKKLRSEGRWGGEAVHYGLKPEKLPTGGYRLVHDDVAVAVIRRVVADVMRGDSVQSIADRLTAEGIASPRDRQRQLQGKDTSGAAWGATTLHKMLESKTLLGYTVHKGDVDPEVMKSDPILTIGKFQSLQGALESRKKPKQVNRTNNASPLLGVAECLECEASMHQRSQRVNGKQYRYYYCPTRHGSQIRAEHLEEFLEETFLKELGEVERHEPVIIPASDHTDELESAKMQLEMFASSMRKASSITVLEMLSAQVADLDTRIAELEQMPVQPARTEHVPTGRTYGQDWADADTAARRRLLLDSGIRCGVILRGRTRSTRGLLEGVMAIPPDIQARMKARQGATDVR